MPRNRGLFIIAALGLAAPGIAQETTPTDAPRAQDSRLVVERFAGAPEIVHPINMAFDRRGRLLVIESHTHFRPDGYKGPPRDRVRVLEDTDGDGKADRFGTFYDGTRFTMDIAAHPDGTVYLATRNEILRLRDDDGDGKADDARRVVFLDTKGDYPHNGLSGLCFDSKGDLYFGMGENLGADYTLRGSDGIEWKGGGEGGHVFWCSADGKNLRRVATGFWNPFGMGRDVFGRLFAVDNDPDAMPPCRLLHIIEGGDYGYQFRYGRSGRHVFQAWNGELPGTLPMVSGTGEAPCEVLSYESDGLPREYLGDLLVTSWADHRVERYPLQPRGASFTSEARPFVQGGKDFRPVGLVVAPDGSLFVSDWVLRDYNLHGKGAVWHVRWKDAGKPERPEDPRRALLSAHRSLRDAAALTLAEDETGRAFLRQQLQNDDSRVRAASLTALSDAGDREADWKTLAASDPIVGVRALAVRALAARKGDVSRFAAPDQPPAVRLEAIAGLDPRTAQSDLFTLLTDPDPFLRSAAVSRLARSPDLSTRDRRALSDPRQRVGMLLACRRSGQAGAAKLLPGFLADPDEDVRFLAAKWIADEKLTPFRTLIAEALDGKDLNVRMVAAYATALARIDGRDVSEANMADFFLARVTDPRNAPALRAQALQLVPASNPRLTLDLLGKLLRSDDDALSLEAARVLSEQPNAGKINLLRAAARDRDLDDDVRAQAVVGLSEKADEARDDLLQLATGDEPALRDEALRALIHTPLSVDQKALLERIAPESAPLVARVLGKPFARDRPSPENLDAWLKTLEGPADLAAGRRVFFHPKLAGCYRCHRVEGRGREVGPDLSTIGRRERRFVLESILQPSNQVGPSYQNWQISTADGKVRTGMLVRTELDQYTFLDPQGAFFTLGTPEIVERRPLPTSIMPAALSDLLTERELRDLLAYLGSRR